VVVHEVDRPVPVALPEPLAELFRSFAPGGEFKRLREFFVLRRSVLRSRISPWSDTNPTNSSFGPMAVNGAKCDASPAVAALYLIRHWRLKWKGARGVNRNWILQN